MRRGHLGGSPEATPVTSPRVRRHTPLARPASLLLAVGVVVVSAFALFGGAPAAAWWADPAHPLTTSAADTPAVRCVSIDGVPPSALEIAVPGPVGAAGAGSSLSVSAELRVLAVEGLATEGEIVLPTLTATFSTISAGPIDVVLSPRDLAAASDAWTNASQASGSHVFSSAVVFPSGSNATLSSSLIAITSPAPLGSLAVEVRWQWTLLPTGAPTQTGPWSEPSASAGVPSILYPQAYVALVRTSPLNATIGESFDVTLAGGSAPQTFLLKLENASTGATLNRGSVVSPATPVTNFSGSIEIINSSGSLLPGHYLIHVHDACGAILYSLPVIVSGGPNGTSAAFAGARPAAPR
ncbi:MAG: hypothetical protein L3K17_08750 [Thermoplasmata archaeon]|nr:hypothetical protein [Thermoplasmata archaeon]